MDLLYQMIIESIQLSDFQILSLVNIVLLFEVRETNLKLLTQINMQSIIFILVFSISFFWSYLSLKLLNWRENKILNKKAYFIDSIIDILYILVVVYFWSILFQKGWYDSDALGVFLFLELIIFPSVFFYSKKKFLLKKWINLKWYYPLNDIFFIIISYFFTQILASIFFR